MPDERDDVRDALIAPSQRQMGSHVALRRLFFDEFGELGLKAPAISRKVAVRSSE